MTGGWAREFEERCGRCSGRQIPPPLVQEVAVAGGGPRRRVTIVGRSPHSVSAILAWGRESLRVSISLPQAEIDYLREIARQQRGPIATVIGALLHRQILQARTRKVGTAPAKQGVP